MNIPFETHCAPEAEGLSSRAVCRFLDETERINLHGLLAVRHGRVLAEGYVPPFTRDRRHRIYSVSKSVTAAAIGILIGEGRLSLDDKICDYFQDKLPENPHPWILATRVQDLLTMALPHCRQAYRGPEDHDWLATFFDRKPDHAPGTIFNYDTTATLIMCHLIWRITGQQLTEYLRPRLFDPIGADPAISCVKAPEGVEWGGSGLLMSLRDMAKIGYVYMNGGRWMDRQLIPEWYCREATSTHIDNAVEAGTGYGYQIRQVPGGFSFNGMGGQYMFAFPEKDLIIATFADTQFDPQGTDYKDLARSIKALAAQAGEPLPGDEEAARALHLRLAALTPRPLMGRMDSPVRAQLEGREYTLQGGNPMGLRSLRFAFAPGEGTVCYSTERGEKSLSFGFGFRKQGVLDEPQYSGDQIGVPGGKGYPCDASAVWSQENKLKIRIYVTGDYLGGMEWEFCFKDNEIGVRMGKVAEWFLDEYQGFAGGWIKETDA